MAAHMAVRTESIDADAVADIFALPVADRWLLHAPRHDLSALVDATAVRQLREALCGGRRFDDLGRLEPLIGRLSAPTRARPAARRGPLDTPLFLGLIPTRGCMLGCRYCDFAGADKHAAHMSYDTAAAAIDGYLALLGRAGRRAGELHFFGGEPFAAADVVQFAVEYAALRAKSQGITMRYEVITNGFFNARLCDWIGGRFDTVIISLDGPAAIHDRYRPALNGKGSHALVARNARRLAHSDARLILRACVTAESVAELPAMAHEFARAFTPEAVCFECLTTSDGSAAAALSPPDPHTFAAQFLAAAAVLEGYGVRAVHSTAVLDAHQLSFCPVGRDALIVSPDGRIDSCYLLAEDWEAAGLDMRLGHVDERAGELRLDSAAVQRLRDEFQVDNRRRCADCFCRYHCCGGCHVHHRDAVGGLLPADDPICIRTRLISAGLMLRSLSGEAQLQGWLGDEAGRAALTGQSNDRLAAVEV